jgi:tRNA uridine 5-carbamoylmethylation protein Kti12
MQNQIFIGSQGSGKTTELRKIQTELSAENKKIILLDEEIEDFFKINDSTLIEYDHILIDSVRSKRRIKFFIKRLINLGISFSCGLYYQESVPKLLSKHFQVIKLSNAFSDDK